MRFRLRTLLVVLALVPPLLAWIWFHPLSGVMAVIGVASAAFLYLLTVALIFLDEQSSRWLDRRLTGAAPRFRFSIRELMLLTVIAALGMAWWLDRRSMRNNLTTSESLRQKAEMELQKINLLNQIAREEEQALRRWKEARERPANTVSP